MTGLNSVYTTKKSGLFGIPYRWFAFRVSPRPDREEGKRYRVRNHNLLNILVEGLGFERDVRVYEPSKKEVPDTFSSGSD